MSGPHDEERGGLASIGFMAENEHEFDDDPAEPDHRRLDAYTEGDDGAASYDERAEADSQRVDAHEQRADGESAAAYDQRADGERAAAHGRRADGESAAAYRPLAHGDESHADDRVDADPCAAGDEPEEAAAPPLDRSPRRVGHRVEGWIRPEYQDHDLPAGDYWTPLPGAAEDDHEPSAHGYGWPVQVERLPPVPAYEPATGFDLEPVAMEPTEVVPAWPRRPDEPAGRIRLPRSWSSRAGGEGREGRDSREGREDRVSRDWPSRDEKDVRSERPRPRPRPRPGPPRDGNGFYVSRHAADPPH